MLSVKFQDGELIKGVSWLELPNKPISKIVMELNLHKIILQNYESYNYLIERVYNLIGKTMNVRGVYLMGIKENKVHIVYYNLIKEKITESDTEVGQEYNGRPSTGWRNGILNQQSATQIF